ncbi:hypothetical protein MTBPR1_140013 [Candidatus Terasakiella magnetica]|uniref:Uncharacterized protein n=1 Tax=Candidatus Terasakiella magnetica TaxID=1867952 RepID=A0A1C3RF63_9PROT|nr:hypothetical protein MTBPR1_140013 [Candidatus Terasakiella magnetica]
MLVGMSVYCQIISPKKLNKYASPLHWGAPRAGSGSDLLIIVQGHLTFSKSGHFFEMIDFLAQHGTSF